MRGHTRRSLALLVVVALGISSHVRADSAVILGAGNVGNWTTTGYVANPNASSDTLIVAYVPFQCGILTGCPVAVVAPSLGSAHLDSGVFGEFGTFYVTQRGASPPPFPIVRASFATSTAPIRSVDIPVVLLSRLMAANISTLNFGGITSQPSPPCAVGIPCFPAHSTLVLGNIQRNDGGATEDLPVKLELFDFQGNPAGSTSLTIGYGQTALIGNVVEYVGGGLLSLGQLRITRTSGGALMWGIIYTTAVNGTVSASAGVNLSP